MNKRNRKVIPFPKAEPALVRAVTVALAFLASLGVSWAADVDKQTVTTIAVVLGLVLPILQGLWTRYVVTPNAQVVTQVTAGGDVVAGPAAVEPTGATLRVVRDGPTGPLPTVQHVSVNPDLLRPPA